MVRIARIVMKGYAHHVVQRGNRRQEVFFKEEDYKKYLEYLKESKEKYGIKIIAYCLMTNHVHLIVVPKEEKDLRKAIGYVHEKYTRYINRREGWRGYLWQGRFNN